MGPHPCDLNKVARHIYLEDLDRNLAPLVFALPYFGKPAVIQRDIHTVVTKRDLYRSRQQSLVAAYPVQSGQTLPPEPWPQAIQRLLSVIGGIDYKSVELFF